MRYSAGESFTPSKVPARGEASTARPGPAGRRRTPSPRRRRTPRPSRRAGPGRGRRTRSRRGRRGRSARLVVREQGAGRRGRSWRRGRGTRGRCRRRAAPGRTTPSASPMTSATSATRTSTRWSASSAGPCGTVPSRNHPTSAGSISATTTRRTRGSASTSASVNPRPSPPTSTLPGASCRASASRASARSLDVSRVSITNTPLARSSSVVDPSGSVRCRSTSSPRSDSARATSTAPPSSRQRHTNVVAMATDSYDVVSGAQGVLRRHRASAGCPQVGLLGATTDGMPDSMRTVRAARGAARVAWCRGSSCTTPGVTRAKVRARSGLVAGGASASSDLRRTPDRSPRRGSTGRRSSRAVRGRSSTALPRWRRRPGALRRAPRPRVSVPRGARSGGPRLDIRQTRRWRADDVVAVGIPRSRPAVAAIRAALWAAHGPAGRTRADHDRAAGPGPRREIAESSCCGSVATSAGCSCTPCCYDLLAGRSIPRRARRSRASAGGAGYPSPTARCVRQDDARAATTSTRTGTQWGWSSRSTASTTPGPEQVVGDALRQNSRSLSVTTSSCGSRCSASGSPDDVLRPDRSAP